MYLWSREPLENVEPNTQVHAFTNPSFETQAKEISYFAQPIFMDS